MKKFISKYGTYIAPLLSLITFGIVIYYMFRTCISFLQVLELLLLFSALSFSIFFMLAKKHDLFIFDFINLVIMFLIVPAMFSIFLTVNFYVSEPIFHQTVPISGHVVFGKKRGNYIMFKNPPEVCQKLFNVQDGIKLYQRTHIEVQINKGLFGLYILRHQKTY